MPKSDVKVKDLVSWVQSGDLRLPGIQRSYVWPATRVRDLLDSLYRGYPSGTILVWETTEEIETKEMAVRPSSNKTTFSVKKLLLDGQQRVTSLSSIATGNPVVFRKGNKPIEILFNLEHPEGPPTEVTEVDQKDINAGIAGVETAEEAKRDITEDLKKKVFVVSSKSLKNDPNWVPVTDIFTKDHGEILKRAGLTSFDDPRYKKYSDRLKKVKDIDNYPYVMEVLPSTMSYEEVTEIFVRVNSLGMKLRGSDLALAQISSKWKGFMDELEEFASEFNKHEASYLIENGILIRSIVTFATNQTKFKTVSRLNNDKLQSSWKKAQDGIKFTINFLKSNAGIDSLSLMSSPFLMVPISFYYVSSDEKITALEEKKLLRWFYLAHTSGHYSRGSSEGLLDTDIRTLSKKNNLDGLLNVLEQHVKRFDIEPSEIKNKGIRSPYFSMLYWTLKHNNAKDWWTGLRLSEHTGESHEIQYHHIFPKSLLKDRYEGKDINEIANMAFIGGKTNRVISNKEPKVYFESIIKDRGEDALKSQLIPMDNALWEIDNYEMFLQERRKLIANEINKFISAFK